MARPAGDLSSKSDNRDRDTSSSICPIIGDGLVMCVCQHILVHATYRDYSSTHLLCRYYFVRAVVAVAMAVASPLWAAALERLR